MVRHDNTTVHHTIPHTYSPRLLASQRLMTIK